MKTRSAFKVVLLAMAPGLAWAGVLTPGLYLDPAGHSIYIGVEDEAPDAPGNEYFDPSTQHTGDLPVNSSFKPQKLIREDAAVIDAPGGALGVSLYYTGTNKRTTIVLIHGNDPETREMGFLIPYFVLNGVNVISYDQRGTGKSSGNWQANGPVQRAADVESLCDAYSANPHVDATRLGVWGFSNGGWTAPIVTIHRALKFMILKSGPPESLETNVVYSVVQNMQHKHYDAQSVASATQTWHALVGALTGKVSWDTVKAFYEAARTKPWFADSYLPYFFAPDQGFPPSAATVSALQREMLYDPSETLQKVHTPTLALFGALDRNVDVANAPALFKADFAHGGVMHDFTLQMYQDAGHQLKVSATGFNSEPSQPERFTAGYPQIMIQWLRQRSLITDIPPDEKTSSKGRK
ncbi:MAG TPA: prolyl oligopeptidase family serine peptidase [Xanthobacteraceae bacterium]